MQAKEDEDIRLLGVFNLQGENTEFTVIFIGRI